MAASPQVEQPARPVPVSVVVPVAIAAVVAVVVVVIVVYSFFSSLCFVVKNQLQCSHLSSSLSVLTCWF